MNARDEIVAAVRKARVKVVHAEDKLARRRVILAALEKCLSAEEDRIAWIEESARSAAQAAERPF